MLLDYVICCLWLVDNIFLFCMQHFSILHVESKVEGNVSSVAVCFFNGSVNEHIPF